jgi:hypothetical protein
MTHNLATGSARAPLADRKDDLYETPEVATVALLKAEQLPHFIWEPACGPGSIVRTLRAHGHDVWATDLVDYGCPDSESRCDFLMMRQTRVDVEAIVTNPPYKIAKEFVEHALLMAPRVIMLLRLGFLESNRRSSILDGGQLARVHVFRRRLPMMHRDGWEGNRSNSAIAYAWFVWDRWHKGPALIDRISWEPIKDTTVKECRTSQDAGPLFSCLEP